MSYTTAKTSLEVLLTDPSFWDSWDYQFKVQAIAFNLWDHIDPDQNEELLERPKMPNPKDYLLTKKAA